MDFADEITQLANRAEKMKSQLLTEEATKNALIMPFMQLLGYDVFNPLEVIPEFTSDVGIKKGEKVDYAIRLEDKLVMLVECKGVNDKLVKYDTQLIRYFHACEAKFAILTNGQLFRFYTDLEEQNKLDEKPFFEFDLLNIKEQQISELKKFHKSNFDIEKIISTASELKYANEIKAILNQEVEEPSDAFIKFFTTKVYEGNSTAKVVEQFRTIIKKTVHQWLSDKVSSRLKSALEQETESEKVDAEVVASPHEDDGSAKNIKTTEEEMEGFMIVKSILRAKGEISKIQYKDNQTYFAVYYEKQTQPICRLHFNRSQKYIGLLDERKKEDRMPVDTLDDIFKHSNHLVKTLENYMD